MLLGVQSRGELLLENLRKFYSDIDNLRKLTTIRKSERISLRIYDYFVCTYARIYCTSYLRKQDGVTEMFQVYLEYKTQLSAYNKVFFDAFSRQDKIEFMNSNGDTMKTTVGQLNFFRWCIQCGIFDYVEKNYALIATDMEKTEQEKAVQKGVETDLSGESEGSSSGSVRSGRKRRRAVSRGLTRTNLKVTVRFT